MTHPFRSAAVVCLLAAAAGRADDLLTLAGAKMTGSLVSVDAKAVGFKEAVSGTVAQVPLKSIQGIDLGHKPVFLGDAVKRDEVELTDGSLVVCSQLLLRGKLVEPAMLAPPNTAPPPKVDLPLGTVFAVCRQANDPKVRDDWKRLLAARGKRDLFVVRGADGFNPLAGTVLGGTEAGDAVVFEKEDGQRVTLRTGRASYGGLVFNQPPRDVIPPTVCKVRDVFGNVLYAQSVELAGGGVKILTVSGASFDYPAAAGIAKFDFAEGNQAYLSDLDAVVLAPPAEVGEPTLPFLKDRTPNGSGLRLDGREFPRGMWVSPDTTLTYKLNADYREFKAVVGVDDRVPVANAGVRVVIEGDGRLLFNAVVRRKDKPVPVTLDVKGVKELRISVEQESLFLGNQLNLAEARVQK